MLARRVYSSGFIRQNGNNNGNTSNRRPATIHQNNPNPSRLSSSLRPRPIPISQTLTIYPTPGSPPPYSWDIETLVEDEPPVPDPGNFSDPAPPHISDITIRGRVTSLRLRPEHRHLLGPIVYGNGRWVLHRSPAGTPADNSSNVNSFAYQALTAILQRQRPATDTPTANHSARPSASHSPSTIEASQTALIPQLLVEMGYPLSRQRTLQYNELSATEQHELALRILAEFVIDAVEQREGHEMRLREEELSAEEGCCTLREYEAGVACEMCLRWGEDIWRV